MVASSSCMASTCCLSCMKRVSSRHKEDGCLCLPYIQCFQIIVVTFACEASCVAISLMRVICFSVVEERQRECHWRLEFAVGKKKEFCGWVYIQCKVWDELTWLFTNQ